MYNQYVTPYTQMQMQMQRQEVVKVNGENGARAYKMAPNSSMLLLDENEPVVWLKMTDGAGYPTLTAYEITPKKQAEEIKYSGLEERIARLEALFNESDINGDTK